MNHMKALAVAGMLLSTHAHAQSAGSSIISLGWLRVMPNSSSDPLFIDSIGGVPVNQSVPNTGARIKDADTVGLAFTHFITDNLAVELAGGVPPRHKITGANAFAPYGEIGSAKQWSPAMLFKWYFGGAESRFRPYVGAGLNYTWFGDEKITNSALQTQVLGSGFPNASSVSTDSSINPVLNVGASYAVTKDWFVSLSMSYLPLKTTAKIDTTLASGAHAITEAKIRINPIVAFLSIGYGF
ncbi:OmpW/AlkL family protein [Ralstonia psammae]|nr:OmpW family protein [Ralstonia sp. LMG 19083]